MTNISKEHSDRLYWLGRYTERFFITLRSLDKLYDRMIDGRHGYTEYLGYFGLPDKYKDSHDFIHSFLYDGSNQNSAAYSLERAYDNGIVLREEISTKTLSFLQMAKDTLISSQSKANVRLSLLPLKDILYSFWGSVNEHIYDDEIRNIIYIGKTIERLDLYMRMKYPFATVEKEFIRLCKNLHRVPKDTPYRYNTKYLCTVVEILGTEDDYKLGSDKAIQSLEHLFDPMEATV
ncbi:MAG: alpha-E domain-containing protein [Ruminococcus sp.]|uniref:alpha-E domain-containing protein n=1 Tax=Ruminococcus sp. TaxID=41978 RepID=UPI0025F16D6A|nr:alpha-E domain-containing protein [Ruminococcus sp.]MCR5601211.1 alpha-E domain-containing protein [Ruminococcus sp.]